MCHYMGASHENMPKLHLYDMLALRNEIKILQGQTIQNTRNSTCILNHFHVVTYDYVEFCWCWKK